MRKRTVRADGTKSSCKELAFVERCIILRAEREERSMNHDQTDSHLFDAGLNDMLPAVVSRLGNIRSISTNDRAIEQDRESVRV
jgi:hypothetical protein